MNRRTFVLSGTALVASVVLLPRPKREARKPMQRVYGRDVRLFIDGQEICKLTPMRWSSASDRDSR